MMEIYEEIVNQIIAIKDEAGVQPNAIFMEKQTFDQIWSHTKEEDKRYMFLNMSIFIVEKPAAIMVAYLAKHDSNI